jgi:uncharacterized protein (DUF58 family)
MPAAELALGPRGLRGRLAARVYAWSRKRQGADPAVVTLARRRLYILPTGLGIAYAFLLFAMLLAGLNYGNNLALALTFVLTALGWVAMHESHRNLQDLEILSQGSHSPFAGDPARFEFLLRGPRHGHYDLAFQGATGPESLASVEAQGSARVSVSLPTTRRGRMRLARLAIRSRYPLGLFRAWTWLYPELDCAVYPRPAARAPALAEAPGAPGRSRRGVGPGDEDFRGLRDFKRGDTLRRIAWKAYARTESLVVAEYQGEAARPVVFDYQAMPGRDAEERLAQLARLVIEADARGERYGIRLPQVARAPGLGALHRHACLVLLADFPGGAT